MIQTTVRELLQGKIDDQEIEGVYMFRDHDDILYIGRSWNVVGRLHDHIKKWASSAIGDLVKTNQPQSLDWQIEIREPEECREIVVQYSSLYKRDTDISIGIEVAERNMIRHYHPCWNTSNNPNPNPLPKHIKRYDSPLEAGATDNLF